MKLPFTLFLLLLNLVFIQAQNECLYISELMINPDGGECSAEGVGQEYFKITNGGSTTIDLTGWKAAEWDHNDVAGTITNSAGLTLSLATQNDEGLTMLPSGDTITIYTCRDTSNCVDCAYEAVGAPNLHNNDGDQVFLFSPSQPIPDPSPGIFMPDPSVYTSFLASAPDPNPGGNAVNQNALASCMLLPIELTSFTVTKKSTRNLIQWTTSSELNNEFFIIEKSLDGRSWNKISQIKGAGNSTKNLSYSVFDNDPHAGINYYRLKQIDYDGQFSFSNIASLRNDYPEDEISIFPNPAYDNITIHNGNEVFSASIISSQGSVIQSISNIDNSIVLDIQDLTPGIYTIRIMSNKKTTNHLIIKE